MWRTRRVASHPVLAPLLPKAPQLLDSITGLLMPSQLLGSHAGGAGKTGGAAMVGGSLTSGALVARLHRMYVDFLYARWAPQTVHRQGGRGGQHEGLCRQDDLSGGSFGGMERGWPRRAEPSPST